MASGKISKENAAELGRLGGKKSAQVRRANAAKPKDIDWFRSKSPEFLQELYLAATGQGKYERLSAREQLQAVSEALKYSEGRPTQMKPKPETEGYQGFSIESE